MGLGNPGDQYRATRHNIGEETIRRWASRTGVTLSKQKSWGFAGRVPQSNTTIAVTAGYMNTSGGPVSALAKYLKVPVERIVVIHDELDLPLGSLKLKKGGGHGGHNGLRDIAKALGTPEFIRVRLGIGRPPGQMDAAAYVLKPFGASEKSEVELMQELAIDAVTSITTEGLLEAQQKFHSPS
ncbi:MAG: aminoacyl-tRNA hydrolase [Pontimonas sp.]